MGDGLVGADRLPELRPCLRVLDTEIERSLCDSERLGCGGGAEAGRFSKVAVDVRHLARWIDGGDVALGWKCRDVDEVEARVAHVPQLLEEERLLDEAEPGLRNVEPAELSQLRPAVVLLLPVAIEREAVGEPGVGCLLELDLLLREREVHQRDLGRPRTRSAMMLRS